MNPPDITPTFNGTIKQFPDGRVMVICYYIVEGEAAVTIWIFGNAQLQPPLNHYHCSVATPQNLLQNVLAS